MHTRATTSIEGKRILSNQGKKITSLWLMKEAENITTDLDVKLNKVSQYISLHQSFISMTQVETDLNDTFNFSSTTSMKPWSSPAGKTSFTANNSPRIGIRHQWRINKRKMTRWRKCDSCSVLTSIYTVLYWGRWGTGETWAGMNIPLQPHQPWIFLSIQKERFAGINNPIMRIMAVEESINKKDSRDTIFIRNYREETREALNTMQP